VARGEAPEAGEGPPWVGGRFEVIELVGSGGAGNVYRVRDHERGDDAALKVAHDMTVADPRLRRRFEQEAELLAAMDHPGVLALRAWSGADAPRPWMATDFCPGGSLVDHLRAAGVPEAEEVAEWALQLLDALSYLHGRKMLHRDIKPENVLVDGHGCAVLADFGVARKPSSRATRRGDLFGTPAYMAPEQLDDVTAATPSSDLYSVGALLFALVTQRPCDALLTDRARQLARLPAPLRPVVARATELAPDARYAGADAMAADLADALEQLAASPG